MHRFLAVCLMLLALPVFAQDIALPQPRPDPRALTAPSLAPPPPEMPEASAIPLPRPRPVAAEPVTPEPAPPISEPPAPRDYQVACPAVVSGAAVASMLPPIHEGQCGLQSPLSLEAISANGRIIPLNAPVTTDCGMATALPEWVSDVDSYVFAHDNTRVAKLVVGTNYACRNVDNAATGNLSFHAFGDALDVVGFVLEDGRSITVTPAWTGSEAEGSKIIRFAHDAACTHFMTVLGPEANALHHDHLHIDLGCHGKSCISRLCE